MTTTEMIVCQFSFGFSASSDNKLKPGSAPGADDAVPFLGIARTILLEGVPVRRDEELHLRERDGAERKEAKHLESERTGLRNEANRLEKERLAHESSTRRMEGEKNALESVIRRSEQERSRFERERQALEGERLSLEKEKDALREERERWEKAQEDRVPQGPFWEELWPAWDCRAYGKREYWGTLQNIPEGWTDLDACMNMPVEIKGVTVRRPYRCRYVDGSPHIHAFWMVDWDQPDCKPWHQDFVDKVDPINLILS